MDINAALDVLVSKESSGAEKSAALKALNIEKQPGSWLPDEVVTGATAGGLLLGSLLPFSKPIRRLAEKRWEPALYAARKAGGKDFYTGIGDFGLLSEVGGVPLKYDTKVSSAFNGATADVVYGPGARHDAKFMGSGAADLGESIGDTIGAGVGALIPAFLPNSGMSNSYLSRLDQLRSGDLAAQQDAAAKLSEGYYKTADNPTWNEAILGAVGGGVGAMAGAAHRVLGRKGLTPALSLAKKTAFGGEFDKNDFQNLSKVMEGATSRTNYRDITRSDVADIMIRGGLGAGYGGSAGTALGLLASGRYADPFDEDR